MNPAWLFMEARVQDCFKVDRQELMGISLLPNAVTAPNSWQRLHNWCWIGRLAPRQVQNEADITALVASVTLPMALVNMLLAHAKLVKGQRVSQTLHH